ncbi:MAG: TolC family protein [Zunongwangia sp.]|jgi:outer membrane protein TolC|uniref:Outer membrane efflux protein n=4 Tax=Zunongwangia profunda TaxID=398743 RepID=D5BDF1_ZUNPS|nr:TolC family protein [Zunongwangia profunda]ADF54857.1 outer membrane efflux protein [Zunongwangia profunda SM-A87]MAO37703.1 TolC family protein [Zunongwangia sp.]MAS71699.1 TolC family protein [Zunongwangia sp.]MCC4226645.1 TolC family protein [Zunongwangia profunda]|tara:strand:+ start:5902 stop:7251 length:1350 start_codon:yes stop_codon:yes gene_type:complete
MLIGFISLSSYAQETNEIPESYSFSLEEAIRYGLAHNVEALNAQRDIAISLKQKWEIIAQGLPQLSGAVDYQNYIKQPVQLLPAEITGGEPGTFIPVTFGTQQSMNATATWNQIIFDGSYLVGIQSAKTLLQITENAKTKTDQEVKKGIINAYGNVLLAEENAAILKNNVESVQQTYDETKLTFENGLAEEEDVEQLEITLLTLKNNLNRSQRMADIAYEMLNITLGLPVETNLTLTEELEELAIQYFDLSILQENTPVEENIDFRIAKNTAESAEIEVKLEKAKALPSLTGYVNYGYQGFSEKFTFLNDNQEYFNQSILGISLNIPIFSSGMRSARTQQKKIALEQALADLEYTKNEVKQQINSAKTEYEYSLDNYEVQKKNLDLAERIENKNKIKFKEGVASSFELNEAQRQLYTAQQDYLQSMLNVITSKVELENLLDTTKYEEKE